MTTSANSRLSRFPPAAVGFVRDLHTEHLEEASFLYDQRNYMLEHIEMEPHDLAWNEQRCDRHLDALVAGGDSTLAICKERIESAAEHGELYAAIRVFCRANRPDLVKTVLDELDTDDAEAVRAVRDGLKHGLPQSWSSRISQWLDEADEPRLAILSVASAYRRLDVGSVIVRSALDLVGRPVPLLWALGQMREPTAASLFQKYLHEGEDEARKAAAIGALRCGDARVPGMLRAAVARDEVWAAVPLALAGEPSDFYALERMSRTANPHEEVALALGLLGHISGVSILLEWLDVRSLAEAAAIALHLLTGLYPLEEESHNVAPGEGTADEDPEERVAGGGSLTLSCSRELWKPLCEELCQGLPPDAQTPFREEDSVASTLSKLASSQLPIAVRHLLGDGLMLLHNLCVSPCDGWGGVQMAAD